MLKIRVTLLCCGVRGGSEERELALLNYLKSANCFHQSQILSTSLPLLLIHVQIRPSFLASHRTMKIAIIPLVLFGLSSAHVTLMSREPQVPEKPGPGKQILDVAKDGIKDWGPFGSLKPPKYPGAPIRNMPGSPRPYHKPHDPNVKTGVTTIPGSPLGPKKKCKPCLRKRDICCDSSGKPIKETTSTKPTKTQTPGKRPAARPRPGVYRPSRFSVPRSAGKAVVFAAVAPYAQNALDAVKRWDNPIGKAVSWFDDAMASLQEAIGGPQRADIFGNELKYKIIKGLGKALQPWETDYERYQRQWKEALERERALEAEKRAETERIKVLEDLANVCEKMGTEEPADAKMDAQLTETCQQLETAMKKVQAQEDSEKREVQEAEEARKKKAQEAARKKKAQEDARNRRLQKDLENKFSWMKSCKVSLNPTVNPR